MTTKTINNNADNSNVVKANSELNQPNCSSNDTTISTPTQQTNSWLSQYNVSKREALDLLFTVSGINICYLIYAVLQERLAASNHSDNKLDQHMFLMLVQCIVNASLVYPIILYTEYNNKHTKQQSTQQQSSTTWLTTLQYSCISLTYVLGMLTSYMSFSYISYPTSVLVKSCKMVPVMLIGGIIFRKRYTINEIICVLFLTAGIYGFMYYSSSSKQLSSAQNNSMYGIILSGCSLLCDGFTGSQQDKVVAQHKPTSYRLMYYTNMYAIIELLLFTSVNGELYNGIIICYNNYDILRDLLIFGLVSGIGQLFIFHMITSFGALPLAITTSTRKLLTILCSTIVFNHHISAKQWGCVMVVFTALTVDILQKSKKRSSTVARKQQ